MEREVITVRGQGTAVWVTETEKLEHAGTCILGKVGPTALLPWASIFVPGSLPFVYI